jgi:hypothetical protein
VQCPKAMQKSRVFNWHKWCKGGRQNVEDTEHWLSENAYIYAEYVENVHYVVWSGKAKQSSRLIIWKY